MSSTDPALDNIITRWLDWLAHGKRLSKHTLRAYYGDLNEFLNFINAHHGKTVTLLLLADCTLTDFRAWVAARTRADLTAASRAREISSVRNFYKFLDREGILHNAAIAVLRSPKLRKPIPRPLSVDAAKNVLETTEEFHDGWTGLRNRALFTLLWGAGLRIDEALRLNCGDWPQHNDHFTIIGKGNKQRQIVILDNVIEHLTAYRATCPYPEMPQRPLFLGVQGKRLNQGVAQRAMRQIRALLNLPDTVTPHALRHSFATHLLLDGVNIRAIQELLGHASLSTTQRYTELQLDDLRSTISAFHPRAAALTAADDIATEDRP